MDDICSTNVNKIAAKAMYKLNVGDALSGTVIWSKPYFHNKYLSQCSGDLN